VNLPSRFWSGVIALCLLNSCSDRDRINPLDPKNPKTWGRPTGFKVISIQDTVFLNWDSIELRDLVAYKIYRKKQSEQGLSVYKLVDPELNSFKDLDVEFGIDYTYQLSVLGSSYESARSDSLAIVPGPTFNWAADNATNQLIKLTHDARYPILRTSSFFTIVDLEPNPVSGEIWVLERLNRFTGNAIRVSKDGQVLRPLIPFIGPVDAALHINSSSLWVADFEDGRVAKLDSIGNRLLTITSFTRPTAVDVDQRTGACWVIDAITQRIAKINSDGAHIYEATFQFIAPQSVAVNSTDGSVWVADSTRVVKLSENGDFELTLNAPFNFASKLDVNEITGDVWVIDLTASTVCKFSADGQKLIAVAGFSQPADLSVNFYDQGCLIADTENQRLVKVTSEGEIAAIFSEIGIPEVVRVQNQFGSQ
jgi:hypothetical protein